MTSISSYCVRLDLKRLNINTTPAQVMIRADPVTHPMTDARPSPRPVPP
jgi:hypothetical protein